MTGPQDPPVAGGDRSRAAQADREQAIEALKVAFVHGRLTKDELDMRAGQALSAQTRAESGGCLGLAFALVLFAANVLDPHGLGNPYHPWSGLCAVVALGLVLTALGIFLSGLATSVEQRRSRRQPPPRPEPGGHALEADQPRGVGHSLALPPDRPDQTRADPRSHGRAGWILPGSCAV